MHTAILFVLSALLFLPLAAGAQHREAPAMMGEVKQYTLCLYFKGPFRDQEQAVADELQRGHLSFINEYTSLGWIVMAGPLAEEDDLRGILLFHPELETEFVRQLMNDDPAVAAGRLMVVVKPWWGKPGTVLP